MPVSHRDPKPKGTIPGPKVEFEVDFGIPGYYQEQAPALLFY
jgi:hypothetical protein